jgi:hypothetical protein
MDEPSWTAAGVVPLRLWRPDEVIASPEPKFVSVLANPTTQKPDDEDHDDGDKLIAAMRRAEAAERDRDWWKSQHDAIMDDWRADVEEAKARAANAAATADAAPARIEGQSALIADLLAALKDLLSFFDAKDGSILFQKDGRTLSEAFKCTAALLCVLRLG